MLGNIKLIVADTPKTRQKPAWNEKGFTIVELVITVTLASIMSVVLFTVTTTMLGNITQSDARSRLVVESQLILRGVVDELRIGSGVRSSNTINDDNAPGGGWTTSNENLILIIAMPAADSNGSFIINPSTGDPYQNEHVYFATEDNTLLKRVLAHPEAAGNTALTNCPAALASSECPADRILSSNFEDMTFVFYDQDNELVDSPESARSVGINIALSASTFGQPVGIENNIRITLRNKLS